MFIKNLIVARKTLFILIVVGVLWYGLTKLLPEGKFQNIVTIIFAFLFAGVYLWSLFNALRRIYGNKGYLWHELAVTVFNVIIFLLTFSIIYSEIGIVNTTVEGNPIIYDYWLCLYYSVITFTSTGYGDFQPQGIGRILASIHAIVGYLVLGIMASTGLSVIQWTADGSGFTRGVEEEKNDEIDLD